MSTFRFHSAVASFLFIALVGVIDGLPATFDVSADVRCGLAASSALQKSCASFSNNINRNSIVPEDVFSPAFQLRLGLIGMVKTCTWEGYVRPLRVVGPSMRLLAALSTLSAAAFRNITNISVSFALAPPTEYGAQLPRLLLDPAAPTVASGYDVLIAPGSAIGDVDQVPGKLVDLSYLVATDWLLHWNSLPPAFRAPVMYEGAVRALPLATAPLLLYYRRDVVERELVGVPQTWEQLATLAERHNDPRPGAMKGVCIMPLGCGAEHLIFQSILSSYIQTQGSVHGVLWDSSTLEQLVNSPAGEEALKVLRRLIAVGPSESSGPECLEDHFARGQCLFAVSSGYLFKLGSLDPQFSPLVRGRMGFALLPGSTRVLDRDTRQLVPCNHINCPLATDMVMEGGTAVLVNRPITLNSMVVLLNGKSPVHYQFYAYELFSMLTRGQRGSDSDSSIAPLLALNELLPTSPDDLAQELIPQWEAAGYDSGDVSRFLPVYRSAITSDNISPDLKIRLATTVTKALQDAAIAATADLWQQQEQQQTSPTGGSNSSHGSSSSDMPMGPILAALEMALQKVVAAEATKEAFAAQYRRSLHWQAPAGSLSGSDSSGSDVATSAGSHSGGEGDVRHLVLQIAVPCGGTVLALAVAAVGLIMWRRNGHACAGGGFGSRGRRRCRSGVRQRGVRLSVGDAVAAPCAGPHTTLCVTDIEESTQLWERLPPAVMDSALKTHHCIIRQQLVRHLGYESATEGDSFILAFHTALDALVFCVQTQQALLEAPWPAELLMPQTLPSPELLCPSPLPTRLETHGMQVSGTEAWPAAEITMSYRRSSDVHSPIKKQQGGAPGSRTALQSIFAAARGGRDGRSDTDHPAPPAASSCSSSTLCHAASGLGTGASNVDGRLSGPSASHDVGQRSPVSGSLSAATTAAVSQPLFRLPLPPSASYRRTSTANLSQQLSGLSSPEECRSSGVVRLPVPPGQPTLSLRGPVRSVSELPPLIPSDDDVSSVPRRVGMELTRIPKEQLTPRCTTTKYGGSWHSGGAVLAGATSSSGQISAPVPVSERLLSLGPSRVVDNVAHDDVELLLTPSLPPPWVPISCPTQTTSGLLPSTSSHLYPEARCSRVSSDSALCGALSYILYTAAAASGVDIVNGKLPLTTSVANRHQDAPPLSMNLRPVVPTPQELLPQAQLASVDSIPYRLSPLVLPSANDALQLPPPQPWGNKVAHAASTAVWPPPPPSPCCQRLPPPPRATFTLRTASSVIRAYLRALHSTASLSYSQPSSERAAEAGEAGESSPLPTLTGMAALATTAPVVEERIVLSPSGSFPGFHPIFERAYRAVLHVRRSLIQDRRTVATFTAATSGGSSSGTSVSERRTPHSRSLKRPAPSFLVASVGVSPPPVPPAASGSGHTAVAMLPLTPANPRSGGGGGFTGKSLVATGFAGGGVFTLGEVFEQKWSIIAEAGEEEAAARTVQAAPWELVSSVGSNTTRRDSSATASSVCNRVVFRGLRVRMGLHSGVKSAQSVSRNAASGRVQYSGEVLRLAKAVSDAGQGGMVLFSQATHASLLLAMEGGGGRGDGGGNTESVGLVRARLGGGGAGGGTVAVPPYMLFLWMGRYCLCEGLADLHLFQVISLHLSGRLVLQQQRRQMLRKAVVLRPLAGALQAPVAGCATVARLSVVGVSALAAWNADATTRALQVLQEALLQELRRVLGTAANPTGCNSSGGGAVRRVYVAEGALEFCGVVARDTDICNAAPVADASDARGTMSPALSLLPTDPSMQRVSAPGFLAANDVMISGPVGSVQSSPLLLPPPPPPPPPPSLPAAAPWSVVAPAAIPWRVQAPPLRPSWRGQRRNHFSESGTVTATLLTDSSSSWITATAVPVISEDATGGGGSSNGGVQHHLTSRKTQTYQRTSMPGVASRHGGRGGSSYRGVAADRRSSSGGSPYVGRAGVMTVILEGSPTLAVQWLLASMQRLPTLDWPLELIDYPLSEKAVLDWVAAAVEVPAGDGSGGGSQQLPGRRRGFRVTGAVSYGEIRGNLVAGNVAGQLSYRGRAWAAMRKAATAAKAGQVATDSATVLMLPRDLAARVVVSQL